MENEIYRHAECASAATESCALNPSRSCNDSPSRASSIRWGTAFLVAFVTWFIGVDASAAPPRACKEFGGSYICTPVLDTYFSAGLGQYQYPGEPPPAPLIVYGETAVEVTSKYVTEYNRIAREHAYWSNENSGYVLAWLEVEYVEGSCDKSVPYVGYPTGNGFWSGSQPTCSYNTYYVTPTSRTFLSPGGGSGVRAIAQCAIGTLLDGFRYTSSDAPPGIDPSYLYLSQGVHPQWVCLAPEKKRVCSEHNVGKPCDPPPVTNTTL